MAFGDLKGTLSGSATSISTSLAISTGGPVTVAVGDLVYAVLAEQAAITSTACADNLGNTYTACNAGTDAGATVTGRAWYSRVTVGGSLSSVTFTANGGTNNAVGLAAVIAGPFVVSPADSNPANVANDLTTPYVCPTTSTLAQTAEVVMCWAAQTGNVTFTATSPNTLSIQLATAAILTAAIGRQLVAATTAVAPAWTSTATPTESALGTTSFKRDLLQTLSPGRIDDTEVLVLGASATLNPADKNAAITLSNGNLTATTTGGSANFMVRANTPLRSGKWYWEATFTGQSNTDVNMIGVQDASWPTTSGNYPGGGGVGFGRGQNPVQTAFAGTGGSITTITQFLPNTSVLAFAYDADAQKLWCWDPTGSAWIGGGSPAAGTLPTAEFFTDTRVYPAVALKSTTASVTFNFGASAFTYSVPSGFAPGVVVLGVLPGAVSTTPGQISDADTVFTPAVANVRPLLSYASASPIKLSRRVPNFEVISPPQAILPKTVTPSLFTDSETLNAPTVSATAGLTPSLLTDSDTLFTPAIASGVAPVAYTAYAAASPFYRSRVVQAAEIVTPTPRALLQTLTPVLFTDSDTFFSPSVTATRALTPSLFTDSDAFFAPALTTTVSVAPSLFTDSEAFFAPAVTGTGAVVASLIVDSESFFAPTVAAGIAQQQPSYSAASPIKLVGKFIPPMSVTVVIAKPVAASLTPNLIVDADTFFTPTVSLGAFNITVLPTLLTDAEAFFYPYVGDLSLKPAISYAGTSPLVMRKQFIPPVSITVVIAIPQVAGAVSPTLFSDADNLFAPTVGRGTVTVSPTLFTDSETLFIPGVAGAGTQAVVPSPITDADNLFAPALTAGAVSVTPVLFTDADVFFAPTVSATVSITPVLFTDSDSFFAPTISQTAGVQSITPVLFTDAEAFFAPTVSAGAVTVSLSRIVDSEILFAPTIGARLTPNLFTDAEVFFAPTIVIGAAQVRPELLVDAEQFFTPQLIYNQAILAQSFADDDMLFIPSVQIEPHYDFPIGKSLDSDYGIRKSRLRRGPYVIGRR